jgi:major capsid protein gp7
MATAIGASNPTLADWAAMREPTGGICSDIVELLAQQNDMLPEMTWQEANGTTYHRSVIRTGMPTATFRQFYQGVAPTKNTYTQVDDSMGMMEARSTIDTKLLNLEGDPNQFRMNEATGFLESMNQDMQACVVYGNQATNAAKFNGFAPRFNDNTTAPSKENIIDAGGTGTDNTSIWFVGWSPRTCFGIFPKGSVAGLQREDCGVQHMVLDGSSNPYSAQVDKFTWDAGLVVKDWRYIVRIANIDVSNLIAESSAADLLKLMAMAYEKIPTWGGVRGAIYANRTIRTALWIQAANKANVYLTLGQEEGKPKLNFLELPIRRVDQITLTEATVT